MVVREDRDDRPDVIGVERQCRHDRGADRLREVGVDEDSVDHVGEQLRRQPVEDVRDQSVAAEDLECDDPHRHGTTSHTA